VDSFLAERRVGIDGKVIGTDFSMPMLARARNNAKMIGARNVFFRGADAEHLPIADSPLVLAAEVVALR
jgi:ubiquinone/menaquinone biosynthesis C-methylase UbiE